MLLDSYGVHKIFNQMGMTTRRKITWAKSSSGFSPKPLSQLQPILAQGIFGGLEFKFIQMKAHDLFQGEMIMK